MTQFTNLNVSRVLRELSQTEEDGVDHINISRTGNTELGRFLTHDAPIPFEIDGDQYESVHEYWQWTITPQEIRDQGRSLAVNENDSLGVRVKNFIPKMLRASYVKIKTYDSLTRLVLESSLRFDHYYVVNPKPDSQATPFRKRHKPADWFIPGMEEIRSAIKENREPDFTKALRAPQPTRHRSSVLISTELANEIKSRFR